MSYTDEEGIVYFCATGPKVIATVGPTGFLQSLLVIMSKLTQIMQSVGTPLLCSALSVA